MRWSGWRSCNAAKRRWKEGDWVCQVCGNYNYSFRKECIAFYIKVIDARKTSLL